ncbi:MAG: hypothetical protein ACI845_003858 [Gammaproteobacteria bacterium]|jgi:hypothetical protein
MKQRLIFLILLFSCFLMTAEAITWAELDQQQQTILKPFQQEWSTFSEKRQQKYVKGLKHWQNLNSEQRANVKKKFSRWQKYDNAQKTAIRKRFKIFNNLSTTQKIRIRRNFKRFSDDLSVAQRKELQAKWKKISQQERGLLLKKMRRHRRNQSVD